MIELYYLMGTVSMAQPQGEGPGGFMGSPFFLIILIVVMFYFILYRPEKKRREERERMLKSLDRGDEVMTAGGILGRITNLTENTVTVEVAPNTKIRVSRQHVSKAGAQEQQASGKKSEAFSKEEPGKKNKKK